MSSEANFSFHSGVVEEKNEVQSFEITNRLNWDLYETSLCFFARRSFIIAIIRASPKPFKMHILYLKM